MPSVIGAFGGLSSIGGAVAQGGLDPLSDIEAIGAIVQDLVGLLSNPHPQGYDSFIGLNANGGTVFLDNESNTGSATTYNVSVDLVEILNQIIVSWQAQGAVMTNPALVIEIRADGSPGMLFQPQYVEPMPAATAAQYGMTQGLILTNGWNDRDSSQYWSLGPINNVQDMVTALYNVFQQQGWINVVAPPAPPPVNVAPTTTQALTAAYGTGTSGSAAGAAVGSPSPNYPTIAQASSGVTATVPALASSSMMPLALLGGIALMVLLLKD